MTPGAVANRNKIESWHTSNEARKKLFDLEYRLAWRDEKVKPDEFIMVKPDVFITGTLKLSKDRKQTTVTLQSFDKSAQDLVDLTSFSFKTDRNIARGLGASFTVPLVTKRSAADVNVDDLVLEDLTKQDEQDKKEDAADDGDKKQAREKKDNEKKEESEKKQDEESKPKRKKPNRPKKRPKKENITGPSSVGGVEVQMLVDEKESAMAKVSDGSPVRWQVNSPAPGQKIVFRLRNNSAQQVGVVVRLNGISTFDEQKADPERCQKWVINPGKFITVQGFYKLAGEGDGGKKKLNVKPIKVLVGAEAKAARAEFADKAGLIEVDVFQEGNNEEEQGLAVSARGLPPSKERKARESYVSLRDAMIKSAGLKRSLVAKREILVPDEEAKEKGEALEVPFKNPLLMAHLAVRVVPATADSGDEGSQDKDK